MLVNLYNKCIILKRIISIQFISQTKQNFYFMKTNWLAILVCVILGMAMGFIWYGALFQNQWMSGNGITMTGDQMFKNGVAMEMSMTPMIFNTVAMIIYALLMNWLVQNTGSTNLMSGLTVGAVIGLLHLLGIITGNMFAGNPMSLSLVDGSYTFALFAVMGAILGAWQKNKISQTLKQYKTSPIWWCFLFIQN